MLEAAAQAVLARMLHRYLYYHFSPQLSGAYLTGLRIYTSFEYFKAGSLLLYSDMRYEGLDSFGSLVMGDIVSSEICKLFPIGNQHEIVISFSGNRVEVVAGFIPNFDFIASHDLDHRLSGPHLRFGYRWERVDLRVYENIQNRQKHIAPFPRFRDDINDPSLLCSEIRRGDWDGIEKAIRAGSPIEQTSSTRHSALATAAARGNLDACRLLISLGAHPDSPNSGLRPLVAAHAHGRYDVIDLLLSEGANPRYRGIGDSYLDMRETERDMRLADRHGEKVKRAWGSSFAKILWDEFNRR